MTEEYTGDFSDVERKAASFFEKHETQLKEEISRRPADLRLPHEGERFRAMRDTTVEVAINFRVEQGLDVPIKIQQDVVSEGEVFWLDYEPVPAETTHCILVPERYKELEKSFVSPQWRENKAYVGFELSVSYVQLDEDFEWLTATGKPKRG